MVKQELQGKCDLLKRMLSIAKRLSENESNEVFELGHYLADNILAKVCMIIGKDNNRDDLIFRSDGKTEDLKSLYNKILKDEYCPEVPDYDYLIDNFHRNRNMYQHKWESLQYSIRKTEAKQYISQVEKIMKIAEIIGENETIRPTNLITNSRTTSIKIKKEEELESKFQELYNRLASKKHEHLDIDLKYILSEIGTNNIEKVLKLNTELKLRGYGYILGDGFLFKIYGGFVAIEKNKIQYNFEKPDENEEVLMEFLKLIQDRCKKYGFIIESLEN